MRKAVSMFLSVLAVACLITAVTDLHVDSCNWSRVGGERPGADDPMPEPIRSVALQVNGGDVAFGRRLRELVNEDLARRFPSVTAVIDGPQPKGGHLVQVALTAANILWTPFYGDAELGLQLVVKGPGGVRAERSVTLQGTCAGLVSRSAFQARFPEQVAMWLAAVLDDLWAEASKPDAKRANAQ